MHCQHQHQQFSVCRWLPISLIAIAAMLCSTGCQTMQLGKSAPPVAESSDDRPMYRLQVVPMFGRASVETRPLESGATVQDVLEANELTNKFRAMDIMLSRVVEESGRVLRMPVEYDYATQSIKPGLNYALHPGDTLSVKARHSGTLDKMIESITGG